MLSLAILMFENDVFQRMNFAIDFEKNSLHWNSLHWRESFTQNKCCALGV